MFFSKANQIRKVDKSVIFYKNIKKFIAFILLMSALFPMTIFGQISQNQSN